MKRILVSVCCFGLLILGGCGSKADSLMKQQIDFMNDLAEGIESGASQAEMEKIQERGKAISEELVALDLSPDEIKKLTEKHKDAMKEAAQKLQKTMMSKMKEDFGGKFPGAPGFGR